MEMVNRLLADSLDGRRFVDALSQPAATPVRRQDILLQPEGYGDESRKARRARERAERKQAAKLKTAATR